jgi:hypothetical protein
VGADFKGRIELEQQLNERYANQEHLKQTLVAI